MKKKQVCSGPNCRQPIQFATNQKTQRVMCLNKYMVPRDVIEKMEGSRRGLFVFVTDNVVRAASLEDGGPFYTSHHATCKDAKQFRRKRG